MITTVVIIVKLRLLYCRTIAFFDLDVIVKKNRKKTHPSEANVNPKHYQLSTELLYIRTHTCHRLLMQIGRCSLEIDLWPTMRKIKEAKRTRINKSMTPVAHTYITYTSTTTAADSGNEANSNSFIVLLSDISGFRINE